jgi:PAS domain S-box-containing protein
VKKNTPKSESSPVVRNANQLPQNLKDGAVDLIPGVYFVFRDDGKILRWNENFVNALGYTAAELTEKHAFDFFAAEHRAIIESNFKEVFAGKEVNFEANLICKDLWQTTYHVTGKRFDCDGVNCFLGIGIDVSEKVRARKSLQQSEERYKAFVEHSNEGIWRFELVNPMPISMPIAEQVEFLYENSLLAECNDIKAQQYGFAKAQELIGKSLATFFVRKSQANDKYLRKFIKSEYQLINNETHEKDKNGDDKYFASSLIGVVENDHLVRMWGVQRDITEIKQVQRTYLESEEQLRRSQKVEAIGRLAGGIAHDFNNFLAVIMLHVDMLDLQLAPDSSLRFRIEEIKTVTHKAAAMVRQLLAFGRKQNMQPNPTVLNNVAQDFVKLLSPLIGEHIEVQLNLDPNLGVCFVDADQVNQVLMNLAFNSRDAMPKGGVLKIETSNIGLNKHLLRLKSQPVGEYIELTVTDTGIGMTPDTRKRIFEPFFTTKEPNKGTGLGLATVYGIVKQSNGFIWVESKPGKGTSFKVQFPRIDQPEKVIAKEEAFNLPSGNETILLVEDEEPVRRAALEVLNILGYKVFEAANGEEAIKLAKVYSEPIHLLLTDVVMPKMNGRETAEKIRTLHPETSVLFMSGYTDDIISNHGVLESNVQFLGKPFTPLMLANKIREVLEHSTGSQLI